MCWRGRFLPSLPLLHTYIAYQVSPAVAPSYISPFGFRHTPTNDTAGVKPVFGVCHTTMDAAMGTAPSAHPPPNTSIPSTSYLPTHSKLLLHPSMPSSPLPQLPLFALSTRRSAQCHHTGINDAIRAKRMQPLNRCASYPILQRVIQPPTCGAPTILLPLRTACWKERTTTRGPVRDGRGAQHRATPAVFSLVEGHFISVPTDQILP